MKIPIIIGILVFSISITFAGFSYAQDSSKGDSYDLKASGAVSLIPISSDDELNPNEIKQNPKNIPEILVQLILRNSQGELIAYIETTEKFAMRPLYLIDYLDNIKNKQIINKDGKNYLLFQFQGSEPKVKKTHSMAMYALMDRINGKPTPIVTMNHDAYQVSPGDQLTVYWTVLREI